MLEALTASDLRGRLGFTGDQDRPHLGPIARAARGCVAVWRTPLRQRVTIYLLRQLVASGFDEEPARELVRTVIDGLIDIGDLTAVRLDGKACLVMSLGTAVRIGPEEVVLLGSQANDVATDQGSSMQLARRVASTSSDKIAVWLDFSQWLGPAEFLRHLSRRTRTQGGGTLHEFWACLTSSLRHEGAPLDRTLVRAVVAAAGDRNAYFGKHNGPTVSGRWSTDLPDGYWCAVRPGRNANEWHPILVEAVGNEVRALDLFDWDEWNWALLARGEVMGPAERAAWDGTTLSFQHPIPDQFARALRLLGGSGERTWAWTLSEVAYGCFNRWRTSAL